MSRVFDNIRQVGYVTPDLDKAMRFMVDKAGIGPWFVVDGIEVSGVTYRGEPLELNMSIALANSGTLQIELIQQNTPQRSMYTEWLEQYPAGDLVHHYSSWSERYDEVYAEAKRLGYDAVQEGRSSYGPFVYYQHRDNPAFIYEVTEFTRPRRRMFEQIAAAAENWDGRNPIRQGWPDPNA